MHIVGTFMHACSNTVCRVGKLYLSTTAAAGGEPAFMHAQDEAFCIRTQNDILRVHSILTCDDRQRRRSM